MRIIVPILFATMAACVRESDVKASPATVWKACIADMKWEKWDEDVVCLEGVEKGLTEGENIVFVMKDGAIPKIPVKLTTVKENEHLEYTGSVLYGLMKFRGSVEISAKDESTSRIKYSFSMTGLIGRPINFFKPTLVVHGTETGLANMVRLSEEAQLLN
jgi:uncharacterized protein YndB with AHSA1/START domain